MKTWFISDLDENSKELLETLEGKNINILIGAGASMPYLKSLSLQNTKYSFEDLFEESLYKKYDRKTYQYLCACFIENSIKRGTYDEIISNDSCGPIRDNYISLINLLYSILIRNSIQQPKRANIFTTNYDMYFEYAFDNIVQKDANIYFNDGSYGFVNKTVSTSRFHTKIINVGVDSRFEYEMPMFNLLKLHGSLNWRIDENENITIYNQLNDLIDFSDNQKKELLDLEKFATGNDLKQIMSNINDNVKEEYSKFSGLLNKLTIVKPMKNKFSETVLEEHYYQMLRILSQELERKQSVLITFGFSFNDEHIRSIIKRSLTNPNLLVYIFCYDIRDVQVFEEMFREYKNIILVARKDKVQGDFTFFNTMLGGL